MPIDIQTEKLLTFSAAARLMPQRRQGRPVHPSTLWRWYRCGVWVGSDRVCLEAVRTPSGMATTAAAMQRFLARLTGNQPAAATRDDEQIDAGVRAMNAADI